MATPNYLLIAVRSPQTSASLYNQLFGVEPVESSETFVLYVLPNGLKIGLWMATEIRPLPNRAGGVEIAFGMKDRDAVLAAYSAWPKFGMRVIQEPTQMDFGFTFVVEDPDGHRLRPFVLEQEPR